ncbi:hypothetical protein ACF08W_28750 [Streptomyces sp. NPDC015144]|uniref:hypothetical protein n=1 Tax=Streptomyces sp. NPDC015144 TaxID=3364944 RepID=UPI0036FF092C
MTGPGNHELAEELSELLGGELPSTLPLEGWRTATLHCQVDAIGPSERHVDLVELEVSFPPPKRPRPAAPAVPRPLQRVRLTCPTCGPTVLEDHPRRPGTLRCVNCKEHLARGRLEADA